MTPRLILGRFTATTPVALFRVQTAAKVKLLDEAVQRAAGRASRFDISGVDGFVHPRDAAELRWLGPNGMFMRTKGDVLAVVVNSLRDSKRARVFEVPAGTRIPSELVLLQERSDEYSLQPAERMKATRCNAALTAFLKQPEVRLHASVADFYTAHPSLHPLVVGFSENA